MDKIINNYGHPYVDLGLPSGTLWATCNVGAKNPSDYGKYFQWGDTFGWYRAGQKAFSTSDYIWNPSGDGETFTKYNILGQTLELEDDAAYIQMGGDWHIPSPEQCQELIDNTVSVWTKQDGVIGMRFISKKDPSKFIFIPAAGFASGGSIYYREECGLIWSSVLDTFYINSSQNLGFGSDGPYMYASYRYYGFPVRGVINGQNDTSKNNKHNTDMNLVEILKDVPTGTELWSYVCGTCYFKGIVKYSDYPIDCETLNKDGESISIAFTKEGKRDVIYPNGKCVLFPSKDNQDWGAFKAQKVKHFDPFQKMLHIDINNCNKKVWTADLFSHYNKEEDRYYLASGFIGRYDEVIPYKGNEDKLGKEVEE